MSDSYTFFMVPLADLPSSPSYPVWFAVKNPPNLTWTTERPVLTEETASTWVIGCVGGTTVPSEATAVTWSGGTKQIPPSLSSFSSGTTLTQFQTMFESELESRGGGDDGDGYTYFMLPLAKLPEHPPYLVWFVQRNAQSSLTWSTELPKIEASATTGTEPPWVIGRVDGDVVPSDATISWSGGTKQIPPEQMTLSAGASLAEFQRVFGDWLFSRGGD